MGMDVFIVGSLKIKKKNLDKARGLFREAAAEHDEENLEGDYLYDLERRTESDDGLASTMDAYTVSDFQIFLDSSGDLILDAPREAVRHEENDFWIFSAVESETEDGEITMAGDEYRWRWRLKDGELHQEDAEMIYNHDEKAIPTIEKIVTLVYPEGLEGKPITSLPDADLEWVVDMIENLLRQSGYGPQAGMTELERLAVV